MKNQISYRENFIKGYLKAIKDLSSPLNLNEVTRLFDESSIFLNKLEKMQANSKRKIVDIDELRTLKANVDKWNLKLHRIFDDYYEMYAEIVIEADGLKDGVDLLMKYLLQNESSVEKQLLGQTWRLNDIVNNLASLNGRLDVLLN